MWHYMYLYVDIYWQYIILDTALSMIINSVHVGPILTDIEYALCHRTTECYSLSITSKVIYM